MKIMTVLAGAVLACAGLISHAGGASPDSGQLYVGAVDRVVFSVPSFHLPHIHCWHNSEGGCHGGSINDDDSLKVVGKCAYDTIKEMKSGEYGSLPNPYLQGAKIIGCSVWTPSPAY